MEIENNKTILNSFEHTRADRGSLLRPKLSVAIVVFVLFLPSLVMAQSSRATRTPAPQRIKFSIGAISAHVAGQFTPNNERPKYVIKAKAGDHMIVNIIPVTKTLTMGGTVKSPDGEGDGGPGGIIMNADLKVDGDYLIEVFQHTMGSNLASGKYVLEVVITPPWLKN
jgi:hypothetical protein